MYKLSFSAWNGLQVVELMTITAAESAATKACKDPIEQILVRIRSSSRASYQHVSFGEKP